jgi:hypothetical protein
VFSDAAAELVAGVAVTHRVFPFARPATIILRLATGLARLQEAPNCQDQLRGRLEHRPVNPRHEPPRGPDLRLAACVLGEVWAAVRRAIPWGSSPRALRVGSELWFKASSSVGAGSWRICAAGSWRRPKGSPGWCCAVVSRGSARPAWRQSWRRCLGELRRGRGVGEGVRGPRCSAVLAVAASVAFS